MSRQFGSRSNSLTVARSFQHLHNRSALLGDARTPSPSLYDTSRSSSPASTHSLKLKMDDNDLEYLESQSDERISGLSAKVKTLKSITGKIGEEIRAGNSLIDTMNNQFGDTGSILGQTMHNFKIMAAKESGATMCYLMFFIVIVVVISYYWFFK
ncbi:hypothetical protein VTP01DRAFT_5241 [Rhizomucor pusillus]|uniref:uncharacterized protein n=1 Tax=Rhizomucor pusillus TaxID=4840 RepID=UPI0037424950